MSYTYGMKGAPAVGNGLGGLPRKQAALGLQSTYTRIVTPGSGVIVPPANAKFMRVAVIGGGGAGTPFGTRGGGGGGGCAATKICPATPIAYSVGAGGVYINPTATDGGDSTASFGAYNLVGGGGKNPANLKAGGIGSGGDYNYTGGYGSFDGGGNGAGGGAAGPYGDGGNAPSSTNLTGVAGTLSSTGWGVGGGYSGALKTTATTFEGAGGGSGAFGAYVNATSVYVAPPSDPATVWGKGPTSSVVGGEMGGGGAEAGAGGVGGMVVEWFY